MLRIPAIATAALVSAVFAAGAAAATTEPIPSSMASTGDSITRGFDACGFFVDCPAESWSTGTDSAINSHYRRILAKNGAINGRNFNDAKTGAKMADLGGQVTTAVGQGVDYVTIEMGANDACTSSESTMTPVATFRAQLDQALNTLSAGLPNSRIAVVSIPNVWQLWNVGKSNFGARLTWSTAKICQSLLANAGSTAQADVDRRARVRQRVIDFNTQLQQSCALHAHCVFDNNAVFNYSFSLSQVSTWDYFHPNKAGQTVLASVSYTNTFGW